MSEQYAAPPPGPQFTISDDRIYGEALLGGYSLIARVYGDPELAAIFAAAPATASERDRLAALNEGLVKALEFFFQALDEEWLIRNIEKDAEPDWVIKSLPWVREFAKSMNVLDEARKP